MKMSNILEECHKFGVDQKFFLTFTWEIDDIEGRFEEWKEFYEHIFPLKECLFSSIEEIKDDIKKKFEETFPYDEFH